MEEAIGKTHQVILGNTILDENMKKEQELSEKEEKGHYHFVYPSMLDGTIAIAAKPSTVIQVTTSLLASVLVWRWPSTTCQSAVRNVR
jgi:hypothetical protein